MIARNPKMGSFLKMEVFSVSEKTLACYKRDVKPCINKQINKQKSSSFDFIKEARKQAKNRMRKANEPKSFLKIKRHTNDVYSL